MRGNLLTIRLTSSGRDRETSNKPKCACGWKSWSRRNNS